MIRLLACLLACCWFLVCFGLIMEVSAVGKKIDDAYMCVPGCVVLETRREKE